MISKDLVFDENEDLAISGGDFLIAQSDDQNIQAIIEVEKGQFYESPVLGYGVASRINGPFKKNVERKAVREELSKDNYNLTYLDITQNFEITLDAIKIK